LATLPLAFIFMAFIAAMFTALGTAIGSLLTDMQGFQMIMNFLVMPLFFLSGALFPLANLPKVMAIVTSLDPLSYGVDGLRGVLIGNPYPFFGLQLDVIVLSCVTIGFIGLGTYFFSKIQL
jgi:ABC-2 type transport system permease protein